MDYIPEEDRGSKYFECIDYLAEFIVKRADQRVSIDQLKSVLINNIDRYIAYRKN